MAGAARSTTSAALIKKTASNGAAFFFPWGRGDRARLGYVSRPGFLVFLPLAAFPIPKAPPPTARWGLAGAGTGWHRVLSSLFPLSAGMSFIPLSPYLGALFPLSAGMSYIPLSPYLPPKAVNQKHPGFGCFSRSPF
jgi:hypothetical protein